MTDDELRTELTKMERDKWVAVMVDLQRRVENLERVQSGGQRRVAERAARILVDPRND